MGGVGVALVLAVSACGGPGQTAEPSEPVDSSTATSEEPASVLAGVDPCQLLTDGEARELGLEAPGQRRDISKTLSCRFRVAGDGPGQLAVSASPDRALDELNFSGGDVQDTEVAGKKAKIVRGATADICTVAIAVSPTESVSADGNIGGDVEAGCRLAEQAAPLVLANLSK
ncbi:DUF3558 domain-containing protein [Saccharopolyspora sp. NPDC000359]|uniref:DUF3558 domain-containing protein n=1 Tax=Saccharopolyspora sp. NPDC000359 TaxID=3154251 RepID=UPI00331F87C3